MEKALIAVLMIACIRPFKSGNKRTSGILGNAILLANNYDKLLTNTFRLLISNKLIFVLP